MRCGRVLLLAACASAVEHPELEVIKDTSGGFHYESSLDYFASPKEGLDHGFVPLAETVLELYGGIDETATAVGPLVNHYAGTANHADGTARGIRLAHREWSTGPNSIGTDLDDAFDAATTKWRWAARGAVRRVAVCGGCSACPCKTKSATSHREPVAGSAVLIAQMLTAPQRLATVSPASVGLQHPAFMLRC